MDNMTAYFHRSRVMGVLLVLDPSTLALNTRWN
jgi:hypothetical protein